jgi:hypothetical protein
MGSVELRSGRAVVQVMCLTAQHQDGPVGTGGTVAGRTGDVKIASRVDRTVVGSSMKSQECRAMKEKEVRDTLLQTEGIPKDRLRQPVGGVHTARGRCLEHVFQGIAEPRFIRIGN